MTTPQRLTAILPCNDLDKAETFFARLGFIRVADGSGIHDEYRILSDGQGGDIHLNRAVEGWLVPGRNPFGLYLFAEDIDAMADRFEGELLERGRRPEHKPWGMYEFSLNGPDDTLIRVGRPSRG